MSKDRDSNIELLRLVCMFLIVFGHFLFHGIFSLSMLYPTQIGWDSLSPKLMHGFALCAVDTFILISGFYSIQPKTKSFFNLYLQCAFYAGILYFVYLYLTGSHINRWCLYNTIMPFSYNPGWWFVPQYLMLYILSPILNKVVENISKRQFILFLGLMAAVILYFGHYRQYTFHFAENGFNFINFVFLYFIGRYLALYFPQKWSLKKQRLLYGCGYIICALLIGLISWAHQRYIHSWNPIFLVESYTHPLCILSAICLFLFAKACPFKCKVVNWFGASALSIYLLQECVYYRDELYQYVANIYDTPPYHPFVVYGTLIGIAVIIVVLCPIVDKVRMLITNPINNGLCKIWYRLKFVIQEKMARQ